MDEGLKLNLCGAVEVLFNTPSSRWGYTKERASVAGMKDVGRRALDCLSVPIDEGGTYVRTEEGMVGEGWWWREADEDELRLELGCSIPIVTLIGLVKRAARDIEVVVTVLPDERTSFEKVGESLFWSGTMDRGEQSALAMTV